MNASTDYPAMDPNASPLPGDETLLLNIIKNKIEEKQIDQDSQEEIAVILNLMKKFKAQGLLSENRRYLELALKSLVSNQPNLTFVRGLRNELEWNSQKYSKGLPKLIKAIAGPSPISALITGLVAALFIAPIIYMIFLNTCGDWLNRYFHMPTLTVLMAASFIGGVVSLLSRLDHFASLRFYNPNLVFASAFFKPLIGVALSIFVYTLLMSDILPIAGLELIKLDNAHNFPLMEPDKLKSYKYYLLIWCLGFISGFSERLANDFVKGTETVMSLRKK